MTHCNLPSFSIVIPTYYRPAQLKLCLESLVRLDYLRDRLEVIVVDDGSPTPMDKVVDPLRQRLSLTLLSQLNQGPAAARNAGAAHAKGRYLAFTDDDCAVAADWLKALAARFQEQPDAMIGGRTINALKHNSYSSTSQLIQDIVYHHYNADPLHARFFATNNLALPKDKFDALGGFAPAFHLAAEDREFCDRWLHQGYQMTYAPEVKLYHTHPLTLGKFWRQHFGYGRGASRFHQVRARRGSSRLRDHVSFHLSPRTWLYPFKEMPRRRALVIVALLGVWQFANSAGFFWERLITSRNDPRATKV